MFNISDIRISCKVTHIDGILPKGPYPPCLRMADRALLAGHYIDVIITKVAYQITSLMVVYNRLFRRRSKKTSKLCVSGHCAGNSPGPVNSPHKGPVTRKWSHLMTSSWYPRYKTTPISPREQRVNPRYVVLSPEVTSVISNNAVWSKNVNSK